MVEKVISCIGLQNKQQSKLGIFVRKTTIQRNKNLAKKAHRVANVALTALSTSLLPGVIGSKFGEEPNVGVERTLLSFKQHESA